jgi:leukotriene-A4 hydrolase
MSNSSSNGDRIYSFSSKALPRDASSLSNPNEVRVKHLTWNITVDFESKCVSGTATYTLDRIDDKAELCLDTNALEIEKVVDEATQASLPFTVHPMIMDKAHLGRKLSIRLLDESDDDTTANVTIHYKTTLASSALQWLPPAQTMGKLHPYLFTQCQAIHARSLVPCQDRPGVKFTYTATVQVPDWAVCVMSAVRVVGKEEEISTTSSGSFSRSTFEQHVPISSYLLALAVGDLVKRDISPRCAIWSEPQLVEAAAYEFAQTEDFLKTAEDLAGKPYVWGRYDLLCLPPSFPYGGMENPCLTFVTPTLLAGDRSLADVVAHEIAHSWTGNLVTNATWDHFWLNEGWTTWFQRKIMARIHKDDRFLDFDAIGGYANLQHAVATMPADFTQLVLNIGDKDPDDSYSIVSYEKGFNLLMALERRVGKEPFEAFFRAYIKKFASQTLTSTDFVNFFQSHFASQMEGLQAIDWGAWLYHTGMPPEEPHFDTTLAAASQQLATDWLAYDHCHKRGEPHRDIRSWSSGQITCFLDALYQTDKSLKASTVQALHKAYGFAESRNAEILFRYSELAVAAQDETMIMVVLYFIQSQGRMVSQNIAIGAAWRFFFLLENMTHHPAPHFSLLFHAHSHLFYKHRNTPVPCIGLSSRHQNENGEKLPWQPFFKAETFIIPFASK